MHSRKSRKSGKSRKSRKSRKKIRYTGGNPLRELDRLVSCIHKNKSHIYYKCILYQNATRYINELTGSLTTEKDKYYEIHKIYNEILIRVFRSTLDRNQLNTGQECERNPVGYTEEDLRNDITKYTNAQKNYMKNYNTISKSPSIINYNNKGLPKSRNHILNSLNNDARKYHERGRHPLTNPHWMTLINSVHERGRHPLVSPVV